MMEKAGEEKDEEAKAAAEDEEAEKADAVTKSRNVGTHFPSCYKCSWENGPDNWIQLFCPISQLHL
jgi:hypothetical protein